MGFFGDGAGGRNAEVDLEDAKEGDVLPVNVDVVGGVGKGGDVAAFGVDFFAEEGFGGVVVVGDKIGVAGVGDGGAGGKVAAEGEALEVVFGDVGGFTGVAGGASLDHHTGLGDGLDTSGCGFAVADGLGPDHGVLGTAGEIFGDVNFPGDGDGFAGVDLALDGGDVAAVQVLEADPAVDLGVGSGSIFGEAEGVILAGDDVR